MQQETDAQRAATRRDTQRRGLLSWRLDRATPPEGVPILDLRSPSEYADDHLPGATNVPLFDDEDRALVGTLYRQRGSKEAFERGIEITTAKVRELVTAIGDAVGRTADLDGVEERVRAIAGTDPAELESRLEPRAIETLPRGAMLVHCWRGGMRSRSVAALLQELGWPAVLLDGGHKAYRRTIMELVAQLELPRAYVLRGLTGVGKTLVLRALERQRPGWTIDLEGLAQHRSSILGMVGLEPLTQKAFETGLAVRAEQGFPADLVVYEGESRKIGDVIQPERLWKSLIGGTSIRLVAPTDVRVRVLADDYLASDASREQLARQLPFIEGRLGQRYAGELCALLAKDRIAELVELLLEHYYDPLYAHSEKKHVYEHEVDTSDPEQAARAVGEWIESSAGSPRD